MFSIKVRIKNERKFLGKSGSPIVYKDKVKAQKVAKKLPKKYEARVTTAIPVFEL